MYGINSENSNWTEIKREAWISSKVYGLSRAIQVSALDGEICTSVGRVKGKHTIGFTYTKTYSVIIIVIMINIIRFKVN